jgi:DNA repair exonuclease SbcCD ATPase subunit
LENRVKKSQALREKLTRLNTVFEAISDRDDELAKSQRDFAEWTSGTAPLNFALEAIRSLEEAIANSKAAGTYPPDFKDVALQRLLDRNQCICGRKLDDDDANTHIGQLLGLVTGAGPKGDALQDLDKEVALFHERRNGLLRRFTELQAVRKSIVGEIDELEIEKSTLQSQVGDGQTIEESEVWEQLNELLNRRKDKEVQFARLEGEFEEKKRQLSTAEGEYQRLAGKSEKAKRLWVEYKFLDVAIAAIDGVYDSIVAQVRELLWTEISKNYKDWHSKKLSSDRIVLDDDFAIYKVNKSGQREPFSQGEFRLLYYSLCIALRTVSGFTFPLIIDSPWGNMDDDSRASLAHAVTGVSKDIQTAIFVLDSEYPATLAKICSVAKPRVFSIEMFDDANSPTKRSTIKSVRN